ARVLLDHCPEADSRAAAQPVELLAHLRLPLKCGESELAQITEKIENSRPRIDVSPYLMGRVLGLGHVVKTSRIDFVCFWCDHVPEGGWIAPCFSSVASAAIAAGSTRTGCLWSPTAHCEVRGIE